MVKEDRFKHSLAQMCVHLHVFVDMCRFFPILPVAVSQFIESQEAKVRIYANLAVRWVNQSFPGRKRSKALGFHQVSGGGIILLKFKSRPRKLE